MRPRFVKLSTLAALAAAAIAVLLAGCGGGGASGKDPAEAAPPDSPVFVEVTVRPEGEVASNVDSLAKQVAGVEDLGALIAEKIDTETLGNGAKLDFEKEIEPLLGEKGAVFLREYDGQNFNGSGFALQVEDEGKAERLIQEKSKEAGESSEHRSFEGVDFEVQEDGTAFGFSEGLLLFGKGEATFKEEIEALNGESLASTDAFSEASGEVPDGAIADAFVDIGALIEESGRGIDAETKLGFEVLGIEPEGSTALISLVPGSDHLELDVSSNVSTGTAAGGDASALLGSLPAGSVAAFASADEGKALRETVDRIDANGIPGEIPPHQLKRGLKQSGFDLEALLGSIGDVGVFVEGNSERNLGGAAIIEAKDANEAQNTIGNLGLLLRSTGVSGVSAYRGSGLTGFSVRSDELGPKPLIVAVGGKRIVVSYGPKAAAAAVSGKAGTLSDDPAFKEAQAALGDTPIGAFVAGPAALTLIDALVSPLERAEIEAIRPYLEKIGYLAAASSSTGERTTATIVAGLAK